MDCKRCGAPLNQGAVLCPECGARQRRRAGAVRCAKCHKAVPLGLTVCPHCGRNVRPAGPRWGWWAAALIAIILVSLWGLDKLPIAQAIREVQAVRDRVSGWVQVLGPVSLPSPIAAEPTAAPARLALVTEPPPTSTPLPSPTQAPTSEIVETAEDTTATEEPMTPAPDAEATATATEPPGAIAPPTGTATPTPEPTATPTAVPTPSPTATLRPPTATPAASGTTTYRVQSGDTLSSIAARFGITWEALAAANGLTGSSMLRVGQELSVPVPGAALPPTATPRPRATTTPIPPTPTPLPQLAAPVLVNPGDQSSPSGSASAIIELIWQPTPGMGIDSQYQVVVRWVEQGVPQEHTWFTTTTGTRVPPWLWGKADQPDRKYTWYVQVIQITTDGRGGELVIPLSPPSQANVFYWG